MLKQPAETETSSAIRSWKLFPIGPAVVLAYLGFVFYTRWQENEAIDQAARDKAEAARTENTRRAVEAMGGDGFEILSFYANPAVIARGERAELCYGVSKAEKVSIEPSPGATWPSYGRCMSVSPRSSTKYTLTATDAGGNVKTATTTLKVR